jgi:hypothetical protein
MIYRTGSLFTLFRQEIALNLHRHMICIFRKNCASVPEERSAIPLQTEQSSAG